MIYVGTSGFSFPDWQGTVYPKGIKKEMALEYYNKTLGFNSVELNFSYYALTNRKVFESMAKRTSDDFRFAVKAYKGLTHEIFDEQRKLKADFTILDKFLYSLEPLVQNEKLAAILFQFPPFFYPSEETLEYLSKIRSKINKNPVVMEFRNHSWANDQYYRYLEDRDIGLCCVDEPKLKCLMPFVNITTGNTAYFRFHGRNTNWFKTTIAQRYDYFYSDNELKEFIPEIKKSALKAKNSFIYFNNCHLGSAAKNASAFKSMVSEILR
ncbi:MAG: DUF72 domain-containing protein [bacterium]